MRRDQPPPGCSDTGVSVGAYYYPEQWPRQDWKGDLNKLRHDLGAETVHLGEFMWTLLEPLQGVFVWSLLDDAIASAEAAGLKIILCTPTACPPVWMAPNNTDSYIVMEDGRRAQHGGRRHGCSNAPFFLRRSMIIVREMVRRYGQRNSIIGWQIDNEIGHYGHRCYCLHCKSAFQTFLFERYQTIDALNAAWGTSFWSTQYRSWTEVPLPNRRELCADPNPHAVLDFRRMHSMSHARFLSECAHLITAAVPVGVWVTHNFRGPYDLTVYPRHVASEVLGLFTLTCYPCHGIDETFILEPDDVGDPSLQMCGSAVELGFVADFARGHNGRFGVMELQPGQVNWGATNPIPHAGAFRAWAWSFVAHGSELVQSYRLRQPSFGSEQYHHGMYDLADKLAQGGKEMAVLTRELSRLAVHDQAVSAQVAIVYDWDSLNMLDIHRQNAAFHPVKEWMRVYAGIRRLTSAVDVISLDGVLSASRYRVLVVAYADLATDQHVAAIHRFAETTGTVICTPRVATRDRLGHFPRQRYGERVVTPLAPDVRFVGIDSVPPSQRTAFWADIWDVPHADDAGRAVRVVETYDASFGRYAGHARSWSVKTAEMAGSVCILGCIDSVPALLRSLQLLGMDTLLYSTVPPSAGQLCAPLPRQTLLCVRGHYVFFFNLSASPQYVPLRARKPRSFLLGTDLVAPCDLAVWTMEK